MIRARWQRVGVGLGVSMACAWGCAGDDPAQNDPESEGAGGMDSAAGGLSMSSGGSPGSSAGASTGASGAVSNGGTGGGGVMGSGGGAATGGRAGADGSAPNNVTDASVPTGDGAPMRSSGCGKPATTSGSHSTSIMLGTTMRTYDYVVPPSYMLDEAIPLVFGFHGNGGDGKQSYNFGINAAAAQAGQRALFIFPNGVQQNGGIGWNEKKDGPDVALFDALVAWAEATFCIDANRIFVAGFSWGNDFANTLGCYRGDKIRAINGFSGGLYNNDCGADIPAYRATYSTPDGTDAYSQSAIDKAVNHYKTAQGCQNTTQAIAPSPCLAYQGCAEPVVFCAYPNMGHTVPPNGGRDAWAFFASFK